MKTTFALFFLLVLGGIKYSFAQGNTVNIYYDSAWQKTSADSAFYRRKFTEVNNYYSCITFRAKNNMLYSKFYCLDIATFPKPIGTFKSYYQNGRLKDSTKYRNNSTKIESYSFFETGDFSDSISFNDNETILKADHYYPDGKPFVHFFWNEQTKESVTQAYDEQGKEIKNFIYGINAEFPGGNEAWKEFLNEHLKSFIPNDNGAPKGKYKVVVAFTINEDGNIINIRAETNYGYGMEKEAIRLISTSPKWKPAIHLNKLVKAYRRQPITFTVDE